MGVKVFFHFQKLQAGMYRVTEGRTYREFCLVRLVKASSENPIWEAVRYPMDRARRISRLNRSRWDACADLYLALHPELDTQE